MTNSADPDQLASSSAKTGHVVFSKRRIKMQPLSGKVMAKLFWVAEDALLFTCHVARLLLESTTLKS